MTVPRSRWATHHYPDPNELPGPGGEGTLYNVVLRPGGVQDANVFTSWASLYAVASTIQGGVRVVMDDSLAPIHIPAAATPYNIDGWSFVNGSGSATVNIDDGAHGTWRNLWIDGLTVLFAGLTDFFDNTNEASVFIDHGADVQCTAAGKLMVSSGGTGFGFITSGSACNIGDGAHTVFATGVGGSQEVFLNGGSLAANAIAGGSLDWDSAADVPDLTTLVGTTFFYESPPNGGVLATNANAAAATIVATAGIGLKRRRSGEVALDCTFSVTTSGAAALTGQFTRGGAPIGPTVDITAGGAATIPVTLNWIDTLPDDATHVYNFQVTASAGTLTSVANQGSLRVTEYQ